MTKMMVAAGVAGISLVFGSAAFAQKGGGSKCADIPLTLEILPVESGTANYGVLDGDARGGRVYSNGVDSVAIVINVCSGTNDATANMVTSRRTVEMTFGQPLTPTDSAPNWAGSSMVTKPFFNVRDLLFGRKANVSAFTTHMNIGYIKGPGDQNDYVLRFKAPGTDAQTDDATPPVDEIGTVPVLVEETRTACSGGTTQDAWTVATYLPLEASTGALYRTASNTPAGLYDMPFRLKFTTKSCVDWSKVTIR